MLSDLPTQIVVYLCALAGLLGLVLGSGLNCLAGRMAAGEKWSGSARSACPACGHTLGAKDLVPLLSWLALRGRCRYCGAKISPRYPITEALLGVCFVSLVLRYGLTVHTLSLMVLCACLLCLSLVDLDTQIIPHRFLVIPAAVRILELLYTGEGLASALLTGLGLGGGVLVLSLILDKVLKKDTMGGGDIKLLALLGLFFPVAQCMLLLILACVVGIGMAALLMKVSPDTPFPFGPALSLAAWLTLLVGEPVTAWYLGLFL